MLESSSTFNWVVRWTIHVKIMAKKLTVHNWINTLKIPLSSSIVCVYLWAESRVEKKRDRNSNIQMCKYELYGKCACSPTILNKFVLWYILIIIIGRFREFVAAYDDMVIIKYAMLTVNLICKYICFTN